MCVRACVCECEYVYGPLGTWVCLAERRKLVKLMAAVIREAAFGTCGMAVCLPLYLNLTIYAPDNVLC